MTLTIQADPVPLRMDRDGGIRVGDSGVLLELVIEAHANGAMPETIVQWFDTLRLADVYAVISYYLNHKEELEEYLKHREQLATEIRREIESKQSPRPEFRQELLKRLAQREAGNAPVGQ